MMILDTYVDYLRQLEPRTESRAVRALLTLGGPRTKKLQVMLNVDGIRFCTRTYVTTDSDQMGQIHLRQEELKLRRIGHEGRMGFTREDLSPTNLRLTAANRRAIYVAAKTPITVLHVGGQDLWMNFLVVESLDDSDQFILGRNFVRNFEVMIDLNKGLIRIRNPDRNYVKKPINKIIPDQDKVPIFLDR